MIMPPPMPSKPDKKPVQAPKSNKPAMVSHGSAKGRVEGSALKMPCEGIRRLGYSAIGVLGD
ncbi:MAG: hypothetical protein RIQ49_1981 [Pseudomonadota bacterium]